MAKSKRKRWMQLSAAVVIVGVIVVAALVIGPLKSSYLTWDRGKVGMPRVLNQTVVATSDLPSLVDALSRGSATVRYAALMFGTPDRPSDEDTVALQVSFENGTVGFDWVLLAPRNIEDQERFTAFARAHGFAPAARTMNGVSYIRVECPDAAKFATSVVTEMYHLPPSQPLAIVHEGFDWPQT